MKNLILSSFLLLTIAGGCATTKPAPCNIPQIGEGQSYSTIEKLLQAERRAERPQNEAAKALKPISRTVALTPPRFLEGSFSGRCIFIFDVDRNGDVDNLDIFSCSSSLLVSRARKAIMQWKYEVPMENGVPVVATGLMANMITIIQDQRGKLCAIQEYPI